MKYCDSCDICYEEMYCPLCDEKEVVAKDKKVIGLLEEKITALEEKIDKLEAAQEETGHD